MKVTLLLETIITSGLSMTAPDHGGVIDTQAKLQQILSKASMPETGYIQERTYAGIMELVKECVESRLLSTLIDIVKEVASYLPGELLQLSKDIKEMLESYGYTTEPLYLGRDTDLIRKGHQTQHLAAGQILYRLRQIYVSIANQELSSEERLKAVDIFLSMLICNPHLQRRVVELCLTPAVVVNHIDPQLPEARLIRIKSILTKLATDELYNLEEEDKVVVPPLNVVDEPELKMTDLIMEEGMEQYVAKPQPWLHFTGMDHLVAMTQKHGTLQEELQIFNGLLSEQTGDVNERIRNALAYIHRSSHQSSLAALLMGVAGVENLRNMEDARLRAEAVRKTIEVRIRGSVGKESIYSHPTRKPSVTKPAEEAVRPKLDLETELQTLMKLFGGGAKLVPISLSDIQQDPQAALKAIMSQLDFGNSADQLMTKETSERCRAALPDLFHVDGTLDILNLSKRAYHRKAPTPPVEISGGDNQLRADIAAMFRARGVNVKVIDEVPNIGINEVHVYQIQVGGALVALQYTPSTQTCVLTANPIEGTRVMEPLKWQALMENVPELWTMIREALNHHDAYWRIKRFLDEAGYATY